MKIVLTEYGLPIELNENEISILVMEDVKIRSTILNKICMQYSGGKEYILLTDGEKEYSLEKVSELIVNPFAVDLNDKRIRNRLYAELKRETELFCYEKMLEASSSVFAYFEYAMEKLPYPISYDTNIEVSNLYKAYDVRIDDMERDYPETLFNYIKMIKELCGINVIILVNIKDFLDKEQLLELYKMTCYNKINLLLIESEQRQLLENEKYYVIDKDNCLICF